MPTIPRDPAPDSTLSLMREGYEFIGNRCERLESDIVQIRLLLQPTICMRGEAAAKVFYDTSRFQRAGAAPTRLVHTLFGKGGVQALDDETHRSRKRMLLTIAMPPAIDSLEDLAEHHWRSAVSGTWQKADEVVLLNSMYDLLFRAACEWAGVPDEVVTESARDDVVSLIESSGAVGPRHWRGRFGRKRANHWAGNLIERTRSGQLQPRQDSALYIIAHHSEADGRPLSTHDGAVELLNIIRPTTAVARYVVWIALAMHDHPECRQKLADDEGGSYAEAFVQEVRRVYPFFPAVAAVVRHEFGWNGYTFPAGRRVLLDLYGTNHDARLWNEPEAFNPGRFIGRNIGPFELIPQGGGDHFAGHRCAGEWVTLLLMRQAARLLSRSIDYDVPPQDLSINLSRMPAHPKSGFIIRNVRLRD